MVIGRPPVTQQWIQQIRWNFLICILYPLWGKCILPFVHWNFCLLCRIFQSWAILPTIFSKLLPSEMAQLHKSGYNNFYQCFNITFWTLYEQHYQILFFQVYLYAYTVGRCLHSFIMQPNYIILSANYIVV